MRRLRSVRGGALTSSGEEGVEVVVARDIHLAATIVGDDFLNEVGKTLVGIDVDSALMVVNRLVGSSSCDVGVEMQHGPDPTDLSKLFTTVEIGTAVTDNTLNPGEVEVEDTIFLVEMEDNGPSVQQCGWIIHSLLKDFLETFRTAGRITLGEGRKTFDELLH